jgi:hypothetical protein
VPNNSPNLYTLGNLPGVEPQTRRVFQDLVDQLNFLTGEVGRLRERDLEVIPKGVALKQSPIEGIITIPYRNYGGQDGQIRVSRDGVIVSYVNPAESIFPYVDLSVIGNITTGTDNLHSFTLPAGVLDEDGDALIVKYGGFFAGNANSKRIQPNFGGQNVVNIQLAQNAGLWDYDITYVRLSPTSVVASGQLMWNFATPVGGFVNTAFAGNMNSLTGLANLSTNDTVLLVQAEAVATDDVVQRLSYIDFRKGRTVKK